MSEIGISAQDMNEVDVREPRKGGYCPNGWAVTMSAQHARKGDLRIQFGRRQNPQRRKFYIRGTNASLCPNKQSLPLWKGLIKNMNQDKEKQAVNQCSGSPEEL